MRKFVTINGKGDFDSVLYHPGEDGLSVFVGARGNGLEDLTDVDFTEIPWDEVEIRKLGDRFYEFVPKQSVSPGGVVNVRGERHYAVFYSPARDALYGDKMHNYEHLDVLGELNDLETDGVCVREAVTDDRIEVPLYEFYSG